MEDEALAGSEMAGKADESQQSEATLPPDAEESGATSNPPSTPAGVNMDVLERWMMDMMAKMENMATREESKEMAAQQEVRRAQQEDRLSQHVVNMATEQTENIKAAMRGEMEAMEARVNTYTNEACTRVKEEIKEEVKEEVEEKIQGAQCVWHQRQEAMMRDVQVCFTKVATLESTVAALAPSTENAPKPAPMTSYDATQFFPLTSAPLSALGGEHVLSPPVSPPGSPSPPPSVVSSVNHHPRLPPVLRTTSTEKKLAEYDGKVPWNAYQAQFEAAASRQGWSDAEKAYQLVTSLKGVAVEVLEHLTTTQLQSYSSVTGALQRRFGRRQQPEVYRAQLKTRKRRGDEPLPLLAQDVETLVRGAYPMAAEDTVDMLAKDCFVDALCDRQLQVHVKQAAPRNVQEALARAAEFEAFLLTTTTAPNSLYSRPASEMTGRPHHVRARRAQPGRFSSPQSQRGGPGAFKGSCFSCGQKGHKKYQCRRRSRSVEDQHRPVFKPCCWACGENGHTTKECRQPKEVVTGNLTQLGAGAATQQRAKTPQNM